VATLHEAEHLSRVTGDLQCLAVELTESGLSAPHDVADVLVSVGRFLRGRSAVGQVKDTGIGLGDHLLAVVDPDQVLLEDVVVEHVLGRFTQVDDPFTEVRWDYPYAMFWLYTEQVAWLSPQIPQIRLVMKWASRGSLPLMKMEYPRKNG